MKRRIFGVIMSLIITLSLAGCGTTEKSLQGTESAETISSSSETLATEMQESESSVTQESQEGVVETLYDPDFTIQNLEDGIKKVTDGDGRELILIPKTLSEIPDEYADSIVIRTPVENAVLLSSTQVCTFRTVNDEEILDEIGGVDGNAETWESIPEIEERVSSGAIQNVGGNGMGEPDYETIEELNPDVVFVYGGTDGQQSAMTKFDELGIPYAVDNEYLEDNYMARMEWMRFILTFFDADNEVDTVMQQAQSNIDEAKDAIEGMDQPKVAMFSIYDGTVTATSDSSWAGSMLKDMGGVNVFGEVDSSSLTMETAFDLIQDADVIIYSSTPSYCDGIDGIEDAFPQITECAAYENNTIYQFSDAYWMSIDQTDVMAQDLASILYPSSFSDRTLTYYQKVEE